MDKLYEISDFDTDVLQRSHEVPVLVDFWAEWCGPCRTLGPILERLAERSGGRWVLVKVNTDVHQEVAARYGIRSIPSVKLFVDGTPVKEFAGALPERAVENWLQKALPDEFRKEIRDAEQMLGAGRTEEGRILLESVLRGNPGHEHARVLLAGTYLYTDPESAQALVREIEEHSEHFALADAIRTITRLLEMIDEPGKLPEDPAKQMYLEAIRDLAENNFDGALERFIEIIKRNRSYDGDGARKAVIAIFKTLGDKHAIVEKHRRSFSSSLYA